MLLKSLAVLSIFLCLTLLNDAKQLKLQHRRMNYDQIAAKTSQFRQAAIGKHPKNVRGRFFTQIMAFDVLASNVTAGTPAQSFDVVVETYTNQAWLVGPEYPGKSPSIYDPKKSKTSQKIEDGYDDHDSGMNILYGKLYIDEISWQKNETFKQKLSVLYEILSFRGKNEPDLSFSGILGLSWTPLESRIPNENSSFVMNVLKDEKDKVFSIYVERSADNNTSFKDWSSITLGQLNNQNCQEPVWFEVVNPRNKNPAELVFHVGSFSIGRYIKRGSWLGAFDASISVVTLPLPFYEIIEQTIGAEWDYELNQYTVDCSLASTLDDWVFEIREHEFRLPSKEFIIDIGAPGNRCLAAFDDSYFYGPEFSFGLPMFRQFCTHYDVLNNKVGLSAHLNSA